jgi:NAD+ diphosphatase
MPAAAPRYRPALRATAEPATDHWCAAVSDRDLVVAPGSAGWALPRLGDLPTGLANAPVPLGTLDGTPVWGVSLDTVPAGLVAIGWLECLGQPSPDLTRLAARAIQVMAWRAGHRYCGACRTELVDLDGQAGRRCPGCRRTAYIKAQPVALVAVWRATDAGREVLLARHTYGGTRGIWAIIGGFVDPAETLEEAARREVAEEVGLEVTDLVYVGSEPWGMSGPDVLLVGFTGRAVDPAAPPMVDGHELAEARYFPTDQVPVADRPRPALIARLVAAV